jgi:RNA polymerase sigma-70 factor, ECF subfamily
MTPKGPGPPDAVATITLVRRVQAGDDLALELLLARFLPRLRRWASGRLPAYARGLADTHDVVQETAIQAFRHLERIDVSAEGALQAYLRTVLLNRLRTEIRRALRRPAPTAIDSQIASDGPSPFDVALGGQNAARYERALDRLRPRDRDLIVARLELGCTHEEVAELVGVSSANAARMAVQRAMLRLVRELRRESSSHS